MCQKYKPEQNRSQRGWNACKVFAYLSHVGVDVELDKASKPRDNVVDAHNPRYKHPHTRKTNTIDSLKDKKNRNKHKAQKVCKAVELDAKLVGKFVFSGDFAIKDIKRSAHPRQNNGEKKVVLCDEVCG